MVLPLQELRKPALLALAIVPSIWAFVSFKQHDKRDLTRDEVESARMSLARLSPPKSSTQQHLRNVNRYGATIIEGALSSEQAAEWNETLAQAFENPREQSVLSRGRLHCDVTSKHSEYHAAFARMGGEAYNESRRRWYNDETNQSALPQLARNYFAQKGIKSYKLTQLQFLNAKLGSENQIWHRDNIAPGVTMLVALCDVRNKGPTELILKSHLQEQSFWASLQREWNDALARSKSGSSEQISSGQPLLACLKAGDAVLYDSRVLHRGRGFTGKSDIEEAEDDCDDRPVLVLRWDALATPPPGAGLIITTANAYMGSILTAALLFIEKVAGAVP
jgi:ectoine hydroxylase-related dioxygenase (phytanoyl-CoA dioxygenase family)